MTSVDDQDLSTRQVSIHTPTQGVTYRETLVYAHVMVSIHTPTQGVTNSIGITANLYEVSIHTPTQGVTPYHPQ